MKWETGLAALLLYLSLAGCTASVRSITPSTTGPGNPVIDEPGGLPAGYRLVWSDEFSADGLPDPTHWRYDTGGNLQGWFNNEKQYYSAGRLLNTRVENGVLILEAHSEKLDSARFPDWGGQAYSSGKIVTDGVKTFSYGFIEVRAKLPCQVGSWPAIWTLSAAPYSKWPDDGEIDIMEHTGSRAGKIQQSTHTKSYNHIINTSRSTRTDLADACTNFHNYQLTWTRDSIKQGIDGRNHMIYRNDHSGNHADWPFVQPQYLLLNLAVGGDYAGPQGIDDTSFPWQMQVDYVRIYQAP